MKRYLLFLAFLLLFACNNETSSTQEKMFLCQCNEEPKMENVDSTITKVKYVFLVKGKEGQVDCCSAPLVEKYPGYREIWRNEAPEHPDVWGMKEGGKQQITAEEARKLGCALQNKEVGIATVADSNEFVKNYYPKLAKN